MSDLISFEWWKCPDGYTIEELRPEYLGDSVFKVGGKDLIFENRPSDIAPPWVHALVDDWLEIPRGFKTPAFLFVPKSDQVLTFQPLERGAPPYLDFAACEDSTEKALNFGTKFGCPASGQEHARSNAYYPLKEFQQAAGYMAAAVALWEQAKRDRDFGRLIRSFNDTFAALPRWVRFEVTGYGEELFIPPTAGPPKLMVALRPNRERQKEPQLFIQPEHLLAAMWLQFAQAVTLNPQLESCNVCGSWFSYGTGTGRRKSAQYCSDKCRKASSRRRKEKRK